VAYHEQNKVNSENAACGLLTKKCMLEEILCDLAKALDCIYHEILLAKLHICATQGVSTCWFKSCLTNRREKVEINSPSVAQNFFGAWRYNEIWCFPRVTSRAFIVHNIYK
jgi:hypothetical protein